MMGLCQRFLTNNTEGTLAQPGKCIEQFRLTHSSRESGGTSMNTQVSRVLSFFQRDIV